MKTQGRVLIVEDRLDWRQMLQGILEREGGYSIQTAATFDEAVSLLQSQPFELVIIDLRLEDWDETNVQGLDLFEFIDKSKGTNAIIVTGYPTPEIVKEAYKEYKVFDFLFKKHFTASEFKEVVRDAVNDALAKRKR